MSRERFVSLRSLNDRADIDAEVARMKDLGVTFTQDVTDYGNVAVAVFDDTCGNLVQLAMMKGSTA